MRKEVKLALAIGGVVLAVLVIYVLSVPSTDKQASDIPQPLPRTPSEPAQPAIAEMPATQPSAAVPVTQPLITDPFAHAAPATMPTAAVSVGGAPGGADWGRILETGQIATLSASASASSDNGISSSRMGPAVGSQNGTISITSSNHQSAPGTRTHTVRSGETLTSIALVAYGNSTHYTAIQKANPKVNPNRLAVGTVLILPDVARETHNASAAGSAVAAPALDSRREYRVQPGDSLEKIASKLYGSSTKWEKIYELNKAKIGADPHKIKAEMVLALPEAPSR